MSVQNALYGILEGQGHRAVYSPRSTMAITGTAALRALVHGIDGDEDGRVTDGGGGEATAHSGLGVAVMMHVGIIEHDLAAAAQAGTGVGLGLHEAVDQLAVEVFSAGALGQVEAGIADGVIDAVDIQRILHHRMADPVATTGTGLVAEEHDLSPVEFDTG